MLKSSRQFYSLLAALSIFLAGVLALLVWLGDNAGQPLKAKLEYIAESSTGLPQIKLTFATNNLPERSVLESALKISPPLNGDFSWNGADLIFTPATRLQPNTLYRVTLRGGLRLSKGGRLDYNSSSWTFQTKPASFTFLRKEGSAVNLWVSQGDGNERRLTSETARQVLSFTVSPGGERLIYSLQETNGREVSLWQVNTTDSNPTPLRLVYENGVKATNPRWSPAGDLIVYERRLVFENGAFSPAQLWLIRANGTSLPPLYAGNEKSGGNFVWSAGGTLAFFWEPKREALATFNFTGEPTWQSFPGLKFETLAAAPDGHDIVVARYDYSGAQERQLLWRLTLQKSSDGASWQPHPLQLPGQNGYNDRLPQWSPQTDSKLVAFVRQSMADRLSRIWLFDTNSGKSWPLLEDEPGISQANFQWSSNGQKLIFERYRNNGRAINPPSEIWEVGVDGKNLRRIAGEAFAPQYLT